MSSEYTILTALTKEDAVYYSGLLRTKEILGDILASATGMGRGRLHWNDMRLIEVPVRDEGGTDVTVAVEALAAQWEAHQKLMAARSGYLGRLADALMLEGADSRLRWLAYKPPE